MKILSIETSCDDTAIALVEASGKKPSFKIISNLVSSQVKIHRKWGGVYPALAKREHQKNLVPLLEQMFKKSKIEKTDFKKIEKILSREKHLSEELNDFLLSHPKPRVDLLAVTRGPGLDPCLWTGVNFAKALSFAWKIPLVGINHIESHVLVNLMQDKDPFPAVCLIASGGHTLLVLAEGIGRYKKLGETKDDAAGECLDKTARVLGLEYPGGPAIAEKAKKPEKGKVELPRPMMNKGGYDFSFSGLKTAVLYHDLKQKKKSKKYIQEMAHEIQQAVIDVLASKTIKAVKEYEPKSLILGGGVTANKELRKRIRNDLKSFPETKLLVPKPEFSTDNAVMGAVTAFFHQKESGDISPEPNLKIG